MRIACAIFGMVLICLVATPTARAAERTEVDDAIDKALNFLHNNQDSDGAWGAGRSRKNAAITGLAVMAFLSAGHVPGEGKYAATIEKGIRWVLKQQQSNGLIATDGNLEMYHHGICTLMLAEAAGMTDAKLGEEIRQKLAKAVALILKAQRTRDRDKGGWRYSVEHIDGSDISVSGWQVMALRAAKNLGCDVPPEAIDRAVEFILRCYDSSTGGFRYTPNSRVTVACTGTSILALELCGKERHHMPEALKGGGYLIKNPPRWSEGHFFYAVYYCAQATFQLGGNYWDFYRPEMQKTLLSNQGSNGAWQGRDNYGPNYATSMGVLALTVEYRFLPIYQRSEEPK